MTTTSLDSLGLPNEAVKKLADLKIESVEAFSSRVSDPTAAENLRLYIGVDSATMDIAMDRAFEISPMPFKQEAAAAGALIKEVQEDSEDIKTALAPLHEEDLARGKLLAGRLKESLRTQLDASEGIEPLRHELRHAPSLPNATAAEIRCTVAISELSHAFESLAYQKVSGKPMQIRLISANEIKVGEKQKVLGMYFAGRIANAIACEQKVAWDLFEELVILLLLGDISLPNFDIIVKGKNGIRLAHDGK